MEFNHAFDSQIQKALVSYLGLEIHLIENVYEQIYSQRSKSFHEPIAISKSDCNCSQLPDFMHYLLTGIDFPVVMSGNTANSKRLMVIGSEPLRGWDYFEKHNISVYDSIVGNTPYSIHDLGIEKTLYYRIIEFLTKSHEVYLTDMRKVWFSGFDRHKRFLDARLHRDFLIREVEIISPERIITFGKNVADTIQTWLNEAKVDIPVEYLIHPSQRTQGEGRRIFFAERGIDTNSYKDISEPTERNAMPYIKYLSKVILS
jgi:hypothetical protein